MGQLELAVAVGTAVLEPRRHAIDTLAMRRRLKRQVDDPADTTHKRGSRAWPGAIDLVKYVEFTVAAPDSRNAFLFLLRRNFPYRIFPAGPERLDAMKHR